MIPVCPDLAVWHAVFKRLEAYAHSHACEPSQPPKILILSGWAYSNDVEKKQRWDETVRWAERNGCAELVVVPTADFYQVREMSSYAIGPGGGPMYRSWDSEPSSRPPDEELARCFSLLTSRWHELVGDELAVATRPLMFTGDKARRLLVWADASVKPPWGNWSELSAIERERRTFTGLRKAINGAIAPHEVDHIDFTTHVTE